MDERSTIAELPRFDLIPKPGTVERRAADAPEHYHARHISLEGVVTNARGHVSSRTVFFPEPQDARYEEIKGYGLRGREVHVQEHCEGDVYHGMYLDRAVHEYNNLRRAQEIGIMVPSPWAVVELDRNVYVERGINEMSKIFRFMVQIGAFDEAEFERAVGTHDTIGEYEQAFTEYLITQHRGGTVKDAVTRLNNPNGTRQLSEHSQLLLNDEPVGFIARGTRSPLRIGDLYRPSMDTEYNRGLARNMGEMWAHALENGLLHYCPAGGNWTTAGELTDWCDAVDLQNEPQEIVNTLLGHTEKGKIEQPSLDLLLEYILSDKITGVLQPHFIKGALGRSESAETAARKFSLIAREFI